MTYPPPLSLIILAYSSGSISRKEYEDMLELWHRKHDQPKEGAEYDS